MAEDANSKERFKKPLLSLLSPAGMSPQSNFSDKSTRNTFFEVLCNIYANTYM